MCARERFLNNVFRIFVNCENCAGDHICALLMSSHKNGESVVLASPGPLDQPTLFIIITWGNGQALSPLRLVPIGLWGLSLEFTGAKKEGYPRVHGFGSARVCERGSQERRDGETSAQQGGVLREG